MSTGIMEMWLLDTSGSMHGERFRLLREAVTQYKRSSEHAQLVVFNTDYRVIKSVSDLAEIVPMGGTDLHLALEYAAQQYCGQVVVFTDGEPSNAEACYEAAQKIPGVVSAIFCGDQDDHEAKTFCDRLSRNNGGRFVSRDILSGQSLICSEVRELLGLPAPTAL